MTSTTRVLVIRHGESTWNAEGRWQGQADPPLTANGEAQAIAAAPALPPFDAVVSSDLRRAARTAALIAEALGHRHVDLDVRLRERHAGAWQGLTMHEVEAAFPGYLADGRRPPGFEAASDAAARALAALTETAARIAGGSALAVSHGGILRAIRKVLGVAGDVGFANLSGQWFEIDSTGVHPGQTVSLLGAAHRAHHAPL